MKIVMNWFDQAKKRFCLRKTMAKDIAEYRALVEKRVQDHWKEHPIRLMELICDSWRDPSTDCSDTDCKEKYNYVVFIDIEGDLDWICDDDHTGNKVKPEVLTTVAAIMDVEAIPCKHLAKAEWMAFKRMLGTAIVSAFEGGLDEAKSLMSQAKHYIEQRIPERSRLWTLHSATCALLLYGIGLYVLRNGMLISPFLFGLLGAYVSLVRHASVRQADSNAGKVLHCTESFVRLLIGMILGKIGVLLFDCSIAPEFSRTICTTDTGMRVVAFAAGLFDAFIPAMISTYIITPLKKNKGDIHD